MKPASGSRSSAAAFAAQRFQLATDLAVEGRSPYPNGAAFVPADLPNLGEAVAGYARERRPVVIVYADGDERVLVPSELSGNSASG